MGASRYDGVEVATTEVPDGAGGDREVRYLRHRRPPASATLAPLARHRVAEDDRLDLIAARYLGDPLAFWRVADANEALDPQALTATPGDVLLIPTPEV